MTIRWHHAEVPQPLSKPTSVSSHSSHLNQACLP